MFPDQDGERWFDFPCREDLLEAMTNALTELGCLDVVATHVGAVVMREIETTVWWVRALKPAQITKHQVMDAMVKAGLPSGREWRVMFYPPGVKPFRA